MSSIIRFAPCSARFESTAVRHLNGLTVSTDDMSFLREHYSWWRNRSVKVLVGSERNAFQHGLQQAGDWSETSSLIQRHIPNLLECRDVYAMQRLIRAIGHTGSRREEHVDILSNLVSTLEESFIVGKASAMAPQALLYRDLRRSSVEGRRIIKLISEIGVPEAIDTMNTPILEASQQDGLESRASVIGRDPTFRRRFDDDRLLLTSLIIDHVCKAPIEGSV